MATAKRDQLIKEAEKLLEKGKLNAAVEQFQKALQQGPPDGVLLNRLGDLLLKANRVEEAVEAYQKAADAYAAQGFTNKAVAAEKKANRANPQKTDTYERLASFYYTLNMPVEGRQQLLILADWYLRSKNVGEAVRIYRQLAEREPGNFQIRAKLVDLLASQGDLAGAGAELEQLGLVLVSRGLLDEAVKLSERCQEMGLYPGKFGPALLDALVIGGRLPTALELVRKWQDSEVSPDLAVPMARVYMEAAELGKAKELLERVLPEVGERTEVVQLYGDLLLRIGERETAKEKLLATADRLLAAGDLERAGQILKRLLRFYPRDVEILERSLKIFDRRQDPGFFAVLEAALADAYFSQGRRQEAAELYMELAEREPGNTLFTQRLRELGVRPSQAEILHRSLERPEPTLQVEEAQSASDVEMEVEIPLEELEAVGGPKEIPVSADKAEEAEATGTQLGVKELYTEAVVLAKYGLTDKALSHLQQLLALDPNHMEGRKLLASLGGSLEVVEEPVVAPEAAIAEEAEVSSEPTMPPLELPIPVPELSPVPPKEVAPKAPSPTTTRHKATTSPLDELEALLGLTPRQPIAPPPAVSPPEIVAPVAPELTAEKPEEIPAVAAPAAEVVVPHFELPPPAQSGSGEEPVEMLAEAVELVELSAQVLEPTAEQLSELDFLLEQGLVEQAKECYQRLAASFPQSSLLTARAQKISELSAVPAALVEHSAEELFAEEQEFFNLAAELEKELEEEEKQLVAEARGEGTQEESFEDLFKQFQRGVTEQLGEEDYATHFDLGLAYREMGLYDEAIGEFQLVLKSPELALDGMTLIANCYMDKGLPEEAASWLEKALHTPNLPGEAELGLRYELGRAWEQAGNVAAALAQYAEVLAVNPAYRDVVDRITRLRTATN